MNRSRPRGAIAPVLTTLSLLSLAALAGCGSGDDATRRSKTSLGNGHWGGPVACAAPDVNSYCVWNYGPGATAVLGAYSDPTSWRCQYGPYQGSVSMNDLCLQQCGSGTAAYYNNPSDPYSWNCVNANVDHCANPNGSEWMNITSADPTGIHGANGYEVLGEVSTWYGHVSANQFSTDGHNQFRLSGTFDGKSFLTYVTSGQDTGIDLVTDPITTSSPTQHTFTLDTPCGTRSWVTPSLTRVFPNAAPTISASVSSDYVNSGTAVTLTVTSTVNSPTSCTASSLVRIVGKQPYDGSVVLDMTFDGATFNQRSFTVHPAITTEYTATTYCTLDPSIRNTAKATVTVYGGTITGCPGNTTPPTFWFCRDCPYNTPPLTNTIVQTACTYDQALQLASQTTFGGACNLADGKCPSCPNPASCPGN